MHEGQYPLADGGTANFVVGMKQCLNNAHAMNGGETNTGGWNSCGMRTWLNNTVYNSIPESFRAVLKAMNVWTANGGSGAVGIYSEDYLTLPAEKEIFGRNDYANSSIESQLFQFQWYKTAANRIKKMNNNNKVWWARSPVSNLTNSFNAILADGTTNFNYANDPIGVSFFCCI